MDLSMNMAMLSSLAGNDKSVNGTDSHRVLKELGESSSSSGLSFQSMLINLINNNLINDGNLSQLNKMIKQDISLNKNIFSNMLMSGSNDMEELTDITKPNEDAKGTDLLDLILSMKGQNASEIISTLQNCMNMNKDSIQLLQEQGKTINEKLEDVESQIGNMMQSSNNRQMQNVIQGLQQDFQSSQNSQTLDLEFKQPILNQAGKEADTINQASHISVNENLQLLKNEMSLEKSKLGEEQLDLQEKIKFANFDNQDDFNLLGKPVIDTSKLEMNKEIAITNPIEMEENVFNLSQLKEESIAVPTPKS